MQHEIFLNHVIILSLLFTEKEITEALHEEAVVITVITVKFLLLLSIKSLSLDQPTGGISSALESTTVHV